MRNALCRPRGDSSSSRSIERNNITSTPSCVHLNVFVWHILSVLAGRAASHGGIIFVLAVLSHYDLSLPGYETAVVSISRHSCPRNLMKFFVVLGKLISQGWAFWRRGWFLTLGFGYVGVVTVWLDHLEVFFLVDRI